MQLPAVPRRLLQDGTVSCRKTGDIHVDSRRIRLKQNREKNACGQVRAGRTGMALVLVVKSWLFVLLNKPLPCHADRNDDSAKLVADSEIRLVDGMLGGGRMLPRPGEIKNGTCA